MPLVAIALALLLALTALAFPATRLEVHERGGEAIDRTVLIVAAVLYVPFIVLADLQHVGWALLGVAVIFLALRRRIVAVSTGACC